MAPITIAYRHWFYNRDIYRQDPKRRPRTRSEKISLTKPRRTIAAMTRTVGATAATETMRHGGAARTQEDHATMATMRRQHCLHHTTTRQQRGGNSGDVVERIWSGLAIWSSGSGAVDEDEDTEGKNGGGSNGKGSSGGYSGEGYNSERGKNGRAQRGRRESTRKKKLLGCANEKIRGMK
ncbi:hypothetical protein LR48_Vigan45s002100 [Vigna angularis]|uniref:Uncharacterized protein n=1 Tax=Phaseolus angularis TaxID=3914 RepID=A0A0L9T4J7_PHAAN|nr:hypothetical protein LR48_Vigan45s002100 [Vigna angularis]